MTPAQFAIVKELGADVRLCKTPADTASKLLAAAGTPDGRSRAERMLRELGGTPATNAVPEELVKALENAAAKLPNGSSTMFTKPSAPEAVEAESPAKPR